MGDEGRTSDINFEDGQAVRIDIETLKDVGPGLNKVLASGCNDGEIGRFEEATGKLQANASGGG